MTTPPRTKTKGRRTRKAAPAPATPPTPADPKTKLESLAALLARPAGASIAEMMAATGWQQHSVRGALAGALKRRGLVIVSKKTDGLRRYKGRTA
jgi:hypothetical protein